MNKFFTILFSITLFSLCIPAQEKSKDNKSEEKPNFSGTWLIDKEKSYPTSAERKSVGDYTVVIAHTGDELKISRKYTVKNIKGGYTETLYTDRREEKNVDNTGMTMEAEIKSETFWKKQTVVRRFLYDKTGRQMPAYIISGEIYSLSKDGKVLTITAEYELTSPFTEAGRAATERNGYIVPKRRLIFNKQE
jgi:hypothetical protein